jgi:hypothetical protein
MDLRIMHDQELLRRAQYNQDNGVGHTPRVLMQGRKKMDSYQNSPVILLGLVPCNPTRTPAL